jgi:hypothetical protein
MQVPMASKFDALEATTSFKSFGISSFPCTSSSFDCARTWKSTNPSKDPICFFLHEKEVDVDPPPKYTKASLSMH